MSNKRGGERVAPPRAPLAHTLDVRVGLSSSSRMSNNDVVHPGVDHGRRDAAHGPTTRVRLGAATSSARAECAARQHHDVPDLAGRAPGAVERSTVEDQPAADPGPHPQAEDVPRASGDAGDPLPQQPDVRVVAERDREVDPFLEGLHQVEALVPVGEVGHGEHGSLVDHAGDADPDGDRVGVEGGDQVGDRVQHVGGPTRGRQGLGAAVDLVPAVDHCRPRCSCRPRRPRPPGGSALLSWPHL